MTESEVDHTTEVRKRAYVGALRDRFFTQQFAQTALRSGGVAIPLVVLWIVLALTTPTFSSRTNINNMLLEGAVVAILAFGTTFVLITGEIDLSIGSIEGFAAVLAGYLMTQSHVAWPVAILAAVGAGIGIGLVNGVATTVVGIPSFIATLATLGIVVGFALILTGAQSLYGFPSRFSYFGTGTFLGLRVPVVIALIVLVIFQFLLRRTTFGLQIYSVGGNERAAALVGIRTRWIKTLAFMISGGSAALGGVLVAAELNAANPTFGADTLLEAIAAVVIGGTALTGGRGSVVGTALGVLVIVTIGDGLDLNNVDPHWQRVAVGGIILVIATLSRRVGRESS